MAKGSRGQGLLRTQAQHTSSMKCLCGQGAILPLRALFLPHSTANRNTFIGDIKDKVTAWKQYRKAAISGENAGLVRYVLGPAGLAARAAFPGSTEL